MSLSCSYAIQGHNIIGSLFGFYVVVLHDPAHFLYLLLWYLYRLYVYKTQKPFL
jgi:hypothetical protein